jgi:rare lipoprotein A
MRALLALLPAAAMMAATAFATAATGDAPGGAQSAGDSDVTAKVSRHVKRGQSATIKGEIAPAQERAVTIRVNGREVGTTRSDADGGFQLSWTPGGSGVYRVKAELADGTSSKPRQVNVYRPAQASYYGPGLYGNGTACGGRLTPSTLGVAHKTLPCGTKLTLRHGRRSVRVRVIDRGPFAGNREYDLTAATKAKLGFGSTGVVYTTR